MPPSPDIEKLEARSSNELESSKLARSWLEAGSRAELCQNHRFQAKKVKTNKNNFGILVCGSGMGMNIAANRHKNIRAAQCFNLKSTKLSRLHNDANIITLGSRLLSKKLALTCVIAFLNTKFEGGRHLKRIKKI